MKRCFGTMILMLLASLFGSTAVHAQKVYHGDGTMTYAQDLRIYYGVIKNNLTGVAGAAPEDKFFATPPGVSKEAGATGEQMSIATEVVHAADAQDTMCTLALTGAVPEGKRVGTAAFTQPNRTKADVMAALAKSFQICDPLFASFSDAHVADMVMSQLGEKPLGSTLFNTCSHDREVYGRILSYLANFGIKPPKDIMPVDPNNPNPHQIQPATGGYYLGPLK